MQIDFRLCWSRDDEPRAKAFRLPGAAAWMEEYLSRIQRYCSCRTSGPPPDVTERRPQTKVWLLDREGPRALPSQELSGQLNQVLSGGAQRLEIVVGGPDGMSREEISKLAADLRWSLGPMTLPHELAAVVAAEQLYRAWTILREEPYHLEH